MGLAMRGLTHCEKCGQALNYDEYVLCRSCEKEKEGGQAMTTEQAVKLLDNLSEYGLCYNITEEYQEAMKLVLSMLEEKDNKISQLKNMNEFQSKDIKKIVDYTFELNKEIEQQDKIIDLMSEQLTTPMHNKEYVKQYFENKVNGGNKR